MNKPKRRRKRNKREESLRHLNIPLLSFQAQHLRTPFKKAFMVTFQCIYILRPVSVTKVTEVKRGHLNLKGITKKYGKNNRDGKENENREVNIIHRNK